MSSGSVEPTSTRRAMRRSKPYIHEEQQTVKITLQTLAAGPQGVARPGTVLDLPQQQAEEMISQRSARPYDKDRDHKAKHGYERPEE